MILVVSASDATRTLIAVALTSLGAPMREAANGRQALEIFEIHPVSLLITDDRMPLGPDSDLLQVLRQRHPELRVIMVATDDGPIRPFAWTGCNAIIHQPFNTGALLALAETLLESHPAPRVTPRRARRGTCELSPPN
jgi:CheY-like chemotaxis protein